MTKYRVHFIGRKLGAIGIFYGQWITLEMESKHFVYNAIQEAGYELYRLGGVVEVKDNE